MSLCIVPVKYFCRHSHPTYSVNKNKIHKAAIFQPPTTDKSHERNDP